MTTLISEPSDPRIAAFRQIRERDLVGRGGRFIAEGEVVVRRLFGPGSRFEPEALLIAVSRIAAMQDVIADCSAPVFAAAPEVMNAIAGFDIHRGVLAVGLRGADRDSASLIGSPRPDDVVLAAVGIGNHDNMGGLFRAAAGFGIRAILLDETCCDPLYRKAIRVSVGAALSVPFARHGSARAMLNLLEQTGYEPWALSPSAPEVLARARRVGPTAVIVGPEGPGLTNDILARCRGVAIPMAAGFDSLNVATAAAITLHHLRAET